MGGSFLRKIWTMFVFSLVNFSAIFVTFKHQISSKASLSCIYVNIQNQNTCMLSKPANNSICIIASSLSSNPYNFSTPFLQSAFLLCFSVPMFSSRIVWPYLLPVIGMSSWIFLLFIGRVFSPDFLTFYFDCIAWSRLGIALLSPIL